MCVRACAQKREGYLETRGGANRAWKRRYFVVLGTRLFYFSDEKRERPLGAIELKECFGVYSVPLARHGRYAGARAHIRSHLSPDLCRGPRLVRLCARAARTSSSW